MAKEKINVPLSKEEIESMVNKIAEHDNVNVAVKTRDGEERIALAEKLSKYVKDKKQKK